MKLRNFNFINYLFNYKLHKIKIQISKIFLLNFKYLIIKIYLLKTFEKQKNYLNFCNCWFSSTLAKAKSNSRRITTSHK